MESAVKGKESDGEEAKEGEEADETVKKATDALEGLQLSSENEKE